MSQVQSPSAFQRRFATQSTGRECIMNTKFKVALAIVAGAVLGATAMQGLHAQAKPKAYIVTESDIVDAAVAADYGPRNQAAQKAAGGRSFRTTGKITATGGFLRCL